VKIILHDGFVAAMTGMHFVELSFKLTVLNGKKTYKPTTFNCIQLPFCVIK